MRLLTRRSIRSHRPFQGQGASLYLASGSIDPGADAILFRRQRLAVPFLQGPESTIGGTNVQKTARVGSCSDPTAQIAYTLPGKLANKVVWLQVRTFLSDVENESNYRPARIELNGSLAAPGSIDGTAELLNQEQRDGGVVRIRFRWIPATTGTQPTQFTAIRTAGPTSPANVVVAVDDSESVYELDTPALLDSAPYTYKIQAAAGSLTKDVLTGITVTADATGPTAPTAGSANPF